MLVLNDDCDIHNGYLFVFFKFICSQIEMQIFLLQLGKRIGSICRVLHGMNTFPVLRHVRTGSAAHRTPWTLVEVTNVLMNCHVLLKVNLAQINYIAFGYKWICEFNL